MGDHIPNPIQNRSKLVEKYLEKKGLAKEHILPYNYFVNEEIGDIVDLNSTVESSLDPSIYIKFSNIWMGPPNHHEKDGTIVDWNSRCPVTPMMCRLRDMTYATSILADIEYVRGNQKILKTKTIIGRMPIMVRSMLCILDGSTEKEIAQYKECPLDPGGYFIIKGQEKVILLQEQESKNRMFVVKIKNEIRCHVTSITVKYKSRVEVFKKNDVFYLQAHVFKEPIPVSVILRAFDVSTDEQIFDLIGQEEVFRWAFLETFRELETHELLTAELARLHLYHKLLNRGPIHEFEEQVVEVLISSIISHIPVEREMFRARSIYLALMVRRVMLAEANEKYLDDRDFLGNKRIDTPGSLLALVFEDAFKRLQSELRLVMDKNLAKIRTQQFDMIKYIKQDVITSALVCSISTGNWAIRRFKMNQSGVTQTLSRLNFMATISMLTRINLQVDKSRKTTAQRGVRGSDYGMICPFDTPEGESCGLVKSLALTAHISSAYDSTKLYWLPYHFGANSAYLLNVKSLYKKDIYLVFINGDLECTVVRVDAMYKFFLELRRSGALHKYSSMYIDRKNRFVFLNSDSGRLCRPYIIVENAKPALTAEHIRQVCSGEIEFDDLVSIGVIEYLDVYESNHILLAAKVEDLKEEHTHLEIADFTIFGIGASIIPFANHNQAPRLTYQCAMGKQAIGIPSSNFLIRMDTISYNLVYPQRPIVTTKPSQILNYDKLPAGQNAIVAIMSCSGYDIEDAIVINKDAIERGFGAVVVRKTYKAVLQKYECQTVDTVMRPEIDAETKQPIKKHEVLGPDGIAEPGLRVFKGQVLINIHTPTRRSIQPPIHESLIDTVNSHKPTPLLYKENMPGIIEQVMITENQEGFTLIKVVVRQMRQSEVGDKFSSRHGQKGVIGLVADSDFLPYTKDGMTPDIIMNPHGFPSRMTVGKLYEVMAGKIGSLTVNLQDATVFEKRDLEEAGALLKLYGYNSWTKETMFSGRTGQPLEALISTGTVYYQKLKHMVEDKIHARARGPIENLTRQPTEGRAKDGGLRVGEMERDCLIGYGASSLLTERFMISSDSYAVDVCNRCGYTGFRGWCHFCRSSQEVNEIRIPYAFKLLINELIAMNIRPRFSLRSINE